MDIYDKYKNLDLVNKIDDNFSTKLNQYKVYNQDESLTCWIYAAFNTIKNEVAELLNININNIDFSVNYISFYDRIEKLNKLYDEVINNNYHISEIKYLLFKYINTCGDFKSFKYLVNKYGLVFDNQMPMTANNYEPGNIDNLLKQKVIVDIEEIMNKKINKLSLLKLKEKYMKENYQILSHIYGKPPKFTSISNIKLSVNKFYNKYIKNIVNNYVSICCLDNLQYEKYYDINFLDMKIDDGKYLNLDLTHIKTSIIKSLKNNHPVWFGCSFRYMSGSYKNTDGILDDRLYLFDKIGIKKTSKSLAEKYDMLDYSHAMIFTGYNKKNNVVKWQVLNTFGNQNNRKGYFVMNDNFFDSSVFIFAINKKYL